MAIVPQTLRAGTWDLPDVPPFVQAVLALFLEPIMAWLQTQVERTLLARCADHPLVLINQWYDPAAVVTACADFHHAPDTPGRPPTFSITQYVRMEMVRAWADTCSDPALEELLTTNFLVRWFVGLPLLQPAPDHSTLAAFHAYMTAHAAAALFTDTLAFLDRVDPEDPATTPQIVDTFALESPVTPTRSVAYLLAHLTRRLVGTWCRYAPAASQGAIPPLDLTTLVRLPYVKTAHERLQRLQTIVAAVHRVVDGVTPHVAELPPPHGATVQAYLAMLAKVQADELIGDATGSVRERPTNDRGDYRCASAVDYEATFRLHEGSPAVLGYNAIISTTATRIRAALCLTGAASDGLAPAAALQQQRDAGRPLPADLVMDQAGGWGKTRMRVHAVSDGVTRMTARVPQAGGSDPTRFNVTDFTVDAARPCCTCPHGVVSTKAYASPAHDGVYFRFLASQCAGCPQWARCRDPKANPKGHRTVFISDYHAVQRAAAAFNRTPEAKALFGMRWRVEPTIAWLVRFQGCRRARRVGMAAAQCQLFQACAIRNLLSWLGRMRRGAVRPPP